MADSIQTGNRSRFGNPPDRNSPISGGFERGWTRSMLLAPAALRLAVALALAGLLWLAFFWAAGPTHLR